MEKLITKEDFQEATMDLLRSSLKDDALFIRDFVSDNIDELDKNDVSEALAEQYSIIEDLEDCLVRTNNGCCGIDEMIMIYTMNANRIKELRFKLIEKINKKEK